MVIVGVINTLPAQVKGFILDKNIDIPIVISSLGLNGYYLYGEPRVEKMEIEELLSLNRSQVAEWDRSATYNWNINATQWSDITQVTAIILPVALFSSATIRNDWLAISAVLGETAALITGISGVTKISVQRRRPFVFNDEAPYEPKYRRTAKYSFFSGHTSISSAMSFAGATIFSEYYPDSKWKKYIWAGAITLPAVTGYLRYEAGKHYLSDVAVGYVAGALVGYFVPYFHKKRRKSSSISVGSSRIMDASGVRLVYTF